jgi:hypothetical protein
MGARGLLAIAVLVLGGCGDNIHLGGGTLIVSPQVDLRTSESGGVVELTVALTNEPARDVTIELVSLDPTEGTVEPAMLTFTRANYDQPQTAMLIGVDDDIADGDTPYLVRISGPSVGAVELDVVNEDNDDLGIAVVAPSSLATSEAGTQDSFTVVLQSQPTANVTIAVASSDTTEATVSTSQLEFTPANWNQPQTVTVTGVDDAIDDGDQPFTIILGAASSEDPMYAGFDPVDVTGTNSDDDTAGIVVTPTSGLTTSEAGGADTFTVVLTSEPTADVAIALSSSDTSEGVVAPMMLTFTAQNWSEPQIVTVTGVDDALEDGDQMYTVVLAPAVSQDAGYSGIDPSDVTVKNLDNDTTGVTVEPVDGLMVSEFGDTDTFTIVLDTAPTANVTIMLSSSNPQEGTVSPSMVTFTPQNWNMPQTVTVTGVDDLIIDGDQVFDIITGPAVSDDPLYDGLDVADVQVTNIDNDFAQVYVKARKRLMVSENGQSATFRVRLTVAPTATVTCPVTSSDPTEGIVSPQTLVFQPNQFGFQLVTVTGVDDDEKDGNIAFTIILGPCTSADTSYNGADPRDVTAINRDND